MHELSLCDSILRIAHEHVPVGMRLRGVRVIVGPMHAIDPHAMQFAWQAVTSDQQLDAVELQLIRKPWTLRCARCAEQWDDVDLESHCPFCGTAIGHPMGGDELRIESIEVDEGSAVKGALPCPSSRLSKTS